MLSYTALRSRYGSFTDNDETANLTLGDAMMNEAIRFYCAANGGKWWFLEKVTTQSTVASQQAYVLPQATRKIIDLYVTVGTTVYSPVAVEDPVLWKRVLQSNLGTGDRALFYYRQGNRVLLAPTPASTAGTITIRVRKNVADLSVADYVTGTAALTLADETLTGSGTTFTAAMVGRFFRATSGDMQWYEIAAFTDTTHMELLQDYEGATVSGSAFIIGEMSPLPEAYQDLPVLRAAGMYWRKEGDGNRAKMYEERAAELFDAMLAESNEKSEGTYLPPVSSMAFRDPNVPEPDAPGSSFT